MAFVAITCVSEASYQTFWLQGAICRVQSMISWRHREAPTIQGARSSVHFYPEKFKQILPHLLITMSVKPSAQPARICLAVRGLFSAKVFFSPLSSLTRVTASLKAKNTEHPKKSPASPIP